MKKINRSASLPLLAWLTLSLAVAAAVPPPEKLLPDDTLLVFTIPDYSKARSSFGESAGLQLWRDPAMKPFTEKLSSKIQDQFIQPFERDLGIRFADYADLL